MKAQTPKTFKSQKVTNETYNLIQKYKGGLKAYAFVEKAVKFYTIHYGGYNEKSK